MFYYSGILMTCIIITKMEAIIIQQLLVVLSDVFIHRSLDTAPMEAW